MTERLFTPLLFAALLLFVATTMWISVAYAQAAFDIAAAAAARDLATVEAMGGGALR